MTRGASTVTDSVWVALASMASVTTRVNVDVPTPVGVPDTSPVVGSKESPTGRLPSVTDQV